MKMETNTLKYFKLVQEINREYHSTLLSSKLHFRANFNSFSLISLAKETAEKGISGLKDRMLAINYLENFDKVKLVAPKRSTPEKELQAWIIYSAISNNNFLPFCKGLRFITSELVMMHKPEYGLSKKKRDIRNDILAIDEDNKICIIELKSSRVNKVKQQTIDFEKVILNEIDLFSELTLVLTEREWSGVCRKIAVWPKLASGNGKKDYMFPDIEEINYSEDSEGWGYVFEKNSN